MTINWPNHAIQINSDQSDTKISKLSDILSFFLTLTWLREGFNPLPGCALGNSGVGAGDAGGAIASPSKFF